MWLFSVCLGVSGVQGEADWEGAEELSDEEQATAGGGGKAQEPAEWRE